VPLYEFTCESCQTDSELLLRIDEKPECPQCGSGKMEKLLSVPAAHSASGNSSLPICHPDAGGGCAAPQCGMGGCQMWAVSQPLGDMSKKQNGEITRSRRSAGQSLPLLLAC